MPARAEGRRLTTRAGLRVAVVVGVTVILAAVMGGCGSDDDTATETPEVELTGVRTYDDLARNHVAGPVAYAQTPPVGGDHSRVWQNCGFYSRPIVTEQGVHSMEHGAVWVTYDPALPGDQVATLRALAGSTHVLVTPFPGLPSPVVASAWGVQLELSSADDPRLEAFVDEYLQGPQTPEPGAPCTGADGDPE